MRAQITTLTDVQTFQPLFNDLFIGENYEYVDAFSCIPFIKTRDVTDHAVSELIKLYKSSASTRIHETDTPGLSLETDIHVVVPLVGSFRSFIYSHFKS